MRDTFSGRGRVSYEDYTDMERQELGERVKKFLSGDAEADDLPADSLRQVKETFKQFKVLYLRAMDDLAREKAAMRDADKAAKNESPGGVGGAATAADGAEDVGDLDKENTEGFHVGEAPGALKPSGNIALPASAVANLEGGEDGGADAPGTPPGPPGTTRGGAVDKNTAFQTYKHRVEEGIVLTGALKEHQDRLKAARKAARDAGEAVNVAKKQIDEQTMQLGLRTAPPRSVGAASGAAKDDEVLDAEEYGAMHALRDAKAQYRRKFDELKALRSEVEVLTGVVTENKRQLLDSFEAWLEAGAVVPPGSRMGGGTPARGGTAGGIELDEAAQLDPVEQFDKLEMERIMREDPESSAFYAARKQVVRQEKRLGQNLYGGEKAKAIRVRRLELAQR